VGKPGAFLGERSGLTCDENRRRRLAVPGYALIPNVHTREMVQELREVQEKHEGYEGTC